jgi:hypothetical protein
MHAMDSTHDFEDGRLRPGALAGGIVLMAAGSLLFLGTSGVIDVPVQRLVGPITLIGLGTLMLVGKSGFACGYRERADDGRRRRARMRGGVTGGLWLLGIGIWMLLAQTHAFGFDFHNSWPLFVILSGVIMLVRAFR